MLQMAFNKDAVFYLHLKVKSRQIMESVSAVFPAFDSQPPSPSPITEVS